jgi:tetratricopeptide (TPR) repeat protein
MRARHVLGAPPEGSITRAAQTFREHAALGRTLYRAGELEQAAGALEQAAELRPQDFWTQLYRGACAYRRGRHGDAVNSFTVAIALAPECAEAYYNRGLAHAATGNAATALHDYDRALRLSPRLAPAALNRGVLLYQQGRYAEALAGLQQAQRDGADPAAVYYNEALVYLARNERSAARECVALALQHFPTHAQARQLHERLRTDR